MESLNWTHILVEGGCYLLPTLAALYFGFRKLMWTLGEFRPHLHQEKKGEALTADGIRYPRAFNGD